MIKICEYTYALRAVDQQTEEYLITAQHASENIKTCQRLLDQRKELLPADEKKDYERVVREARTASEAVALLLEPARVDTDADGKIHFSTRIFWVLSDNANIAAALRRLDIVHTTLTQNIATLRLLRPCDTAMLGVVRSNEKPPSYHSSQLLHWKRQTRLTPKHSVSNLHDPLIAQTSTARTTQLAPQELSGGPYPQRNSDIPTSRIPMYNISSPVEMFAGPVPPSRPVSEPNGLNCSTLSEAGRSGSGGGSRRWLEYQAMKSSTLRETQRTAQNR